MPTWMLPEIGGRILVDMHKFVLDVQGLPGVLAGFAGNSVREGQRVNAPTAALIDPFLKEHGVLVRAKGMVRRDDDWLAPCLYRARLRGRSCRQLELFHRAFLQHDQHLRWKIESRSRSLILCPARSGA